MLKDFSFRNCRSFKEESSLSMEASPALKDNSDFVIQSGSGKNAVYLNPLAAIYGSNAGGKTNLIRAFSDAIENIYRGLGFRNAPYMYDVNDFMHKLTIVCKNTEYEYAYAVRESEVVEEWLTARDLVANSRTRSLFVREGDKIKKSTYKENTTELSFLKAMALNKNNLIMKMAGEVGLDICLDFYKWCSNVVIEMRDLGDDNRISTIATYAARLHSRKGENFEFNDLKKFIIKLDPSISDLSIREDKHEERKRRDESGLKRDARFIMWHKSDTEDSVPFLINAASNGTKKLIELYQPIRRALTDGTLFVCDELDTFLHPLVFKNLVNMFNDKAHNPYGAQLIFTAHNTIVMNRECLRRDEIHFVDKDAFGKSSIFRLSDVVDEDGNKIRMDARYDRLYLAGFFGATPEGFRTVSAVEERRGTKC